MNVLFTMRHEYNQYNRRVDVLENDYIDFLQRFEINLLPMSNGYKQTAKFLKKNNVSRIILSGGNDVSPALYNETSSEENLNTSKERDQLESDLLDYAIDNDIPVLGWCRGMQYINVHFGGGITPNLLELDDIGKHNPGGQHLVKITEDALAAKFDHSIAEVSSYHDQAVLESDLSHQLKAFAICDDIPVVEGLYSRDYRIAGFQWHPERNNVSKKLDLIILEAFFNEELFWKDK